LDLGGSEGESVPGGARRWSAIGLFVLVALTAAKHFQLRASIDQDLVTGKVEEMVPARSLSFGRTKGDVLGQKGQELSSQIRLRLFDKI
jgi:hypothetical protein